jgi:uncharacterized membrane protein (DUF106 family)
MRRIIDEDKAQGSMLLYLLIMIMMILIMQMFGPLLSSAVGSVLEPLIGFNGKYPVMTLFLAGFIVVLASSLLTNFFTDWVKMGESQEITKAFQRELSDARKKGDTNRINKLMKFQPEILRRQSEASAGSMKPTIILLLFIFPIFLWLRVFFSGLTYYYFTVPWASTVSLFTSVIWQSWLWLYLMFSMVVGHLLRQSFKWVTWSRWWSNIRNKVKPSDTL